MSLAINPAPARSASDDVPENFGAGKDGAAGLPFDAILDGQTDASDPSTDVGVGRSVRRRADRDGADLPTDGLPFEPDATNGGDQTATGVIARTLGGLGSGVRRWIDGSDDLDKSAILKAIGKNKPSDESAALLLLAARGLLPEVTPVQRGLPQDVPSQPPPTDDAHGPDGNEIQAKGAAGDRLSDALLRMIETESATTAGQAAGDSPDTLSDLLKALTNSLHDIGDPAGGISARPSDQGRDSEGNFFHPSATSGGAALATAMQAALSHGAFGDQEKGSDEPSTSMAFERRAAKSLPTLIHAGESASTFDRMLNNTSSPRDSASAGALPNDADVVSSIVQTIRLQMRDGVGTAVVHLEPDYLGAVSIALRVENGAVTATMHAENPQVRAWMEANESMLRESLAGQGLSLDRLLVTDERIADERSTDRRNQQEQEQHARQRPRRNAANTFEVVV